MIVDDFLDAPDAARRRALSLSYDPALKSGNYPGVDSAGPLQIEGLDQAASKLFGAPLVGAAGTQHGHCRLTRAGDRGRSGVHVDPCAWSGILYLSRPQDCRGGTDFFRHRRTGLDRVPTDIQTLADAGYSDPNMMIEDVINKDTLTPTKWERVFRAPMKFNRLILFNPWLFHNAGPGFGDSPESARLVQLLFFNRR
ncbi:MAG: DUF6445 family protein [Pseudomonadota bacterium]